MLDDDNGLRELYRVPDIPRMQSRAGLLERLNFLEAAGDRWWPLFSGAYVVVVKKRAFRQPNIFDPASGGLRRQQKPLVSALPRHAAKGRLTVVRG